MTRMFRDFLRSERAAISTDWIVLTGVLLGTGLAVMSEMGNGPEAEGWRPASATQQGPLECSGGIDRLRTGEADGAPLAPLSERDATRLTELECDLRERGVGG